MPSSYSECCSVTLKTLLNFREINPSGVDGVQQWCSVTQNAKWLFIISSAQCTVAAHYTFKTSKWCLVGTQLTFSGLALGLTHKTNNENNKLIWKLSGLSRRDGKLAVGKLTEHALQRLLMRLMLHSGHVSSMGSFHILRGIRWMVTPIVLFNL